MEFRVVGLIVLILFAGAMFESPEQAYVTKNPSQSQSTSERVTTSQASDPIIYVNTETGFQTLGVPGNGTASNPYRLENYSITSSSVCISIIGTDSFFVIRNCTFNGIGTGVRFTLLSNGRIENCSFLGNETGIQIRYSDDSLIESCLFPDVDGGISIQDSNNITINDVTMKTDTYRYEAIGIFVLDSSDIVLNNSYLSDTSHSYSTGVVMQASSNVVIQNTVIKEVHQAVRGYESQAIEVSKIKIISCRRGIEYIASNNSIFVDCVFYTTYSDPVFLSDSKSVGFENCTFESRSQTALRLISSELCYFYSCQVENSTFVFLGNVLSNWVHSFENVTVAGIPVGYFRSQSNQIVDLSDYSQIIIVDCEYLNLAPSKANSNQTAICLAFSSHCKIQGATVPDIQEGDISIISSDNITIENISSYSFWGGIAIQRSQNIRLLNVSCTEMALYVFESSRCVVENSSFWFVNVGSSNDCVFRNIRIGDFYSSIVIWESINCSFIDTQLGAHVEIYGEILPHWNHSFENVTINDSLFGYFNHISNSTINMNEYGHIYLYGCNDIAIQGSNEEDLYTCWIDHSYNIVVEDLNFTEESSNVFEVTDCSNVTIRDSILHPGHRLAIQSSNNVQVTGSSGNNASFSFYGTSGLSIVDNDFINSSVFLYDLHFSDISKNSFVLTAFDLMYLDSVSINNNRITSEADGMKGSVLTRCDITRNEIECNGIGVNIDFGEELTIGFNSISGASVGISVSDIRDSFISSNRIYDATSTGIGLFNSQTSFIRGNLVTGTYGFTPGTGIGIHLEYCVGIRVTMNILLENQGYGVNAQSVTDSIFWGNFFRGNVEGDAREIVTTNEWSSSEGVGNYWADQDNSSRAIIEGGAPNFDENPLTIVEASSFPIISSNPDLSLTYDNDSVAMSWIIWTLDNCTIVIEKDGIVDLVGNATDSLMITYILANITEGYHNITIAIYYQGELHTLDSLMVFMEISNTPLVTLLAACGLFAIVVVLEFTRKRKKATGTSVEAVPVT